jgi:DNA-binding MarR family transcriptional regulator
MVKATITMVKISQPLPLADSDVTHVMTAIRSLYAATDRFDAYAAMTLQVDKSAVRAINAMETGPISPSDLMAALGLTSGAVTSLIHRLETAEHVSVSGNVYDGRRRQVQLTSTGRHDAGRVFGPLGQAIGKELANMDASELMALARCLPLLASAFDKAAKTEM